MKSSAFFKSARVYRLNSLGTDSDDLEDVAAVLRFQPIEGRQLSSIGWVPVIESSDDEQSHSLVYWTMEETRQFMMCLRTESRVLPSAVVKKELAQRAEEVRRQQGYKVGKRQMRDLREAVIDDLMPKAFTTYAHTRVLVMPEHRLLMIEATSDSKCDAVISMLVRTFAIELGPMRTNISPATFMSETAIEDADVTDYGFTCDDAAKFGEQREGRGVVSYKNVSTAGTDMARESVKAGRTCTQLAMTWVDRFSFVLDSKFTLRSIKPLDYYTPEDEGDGRDFEAEAYLFSRDIVGLVKDLTDAMGGYADDPDNDPAADL